MLSNVYVQQVDIKTARNEHQSRPFREALMYSRWTSKLFPSPFLKVFLPPYGEKIIFCAGKIIP